ncbi:MAG: hypothetical protein D6746_10830 [Bacteroidetes bacterium]|nr:MAG: hypothetical protein D6746_10830 [Bacteroidota bacterium]
MYHVDLHEIQGRHGYIHGLERASAFILDGQATIRRDLRHLALTPIAWAGRFPAVLAPEPIGQDGDMLLFGSEEVGSHPGAKGIPSWPYFLERSTKERHTLPFSDATSVTIADGILTLHRRGGITHEIKIATTEVFYSTDDPILLAPFRCHAIYITADSTGLLVSGSYSAIFIKSSEE